MPPAVAAAQGPPAQRAGGGLPFELGTNLYREAPFFTVSQLLDGNPHESVVNITPGGFLRGVVLQVTATGGTLGTTATLNPDAPFNIFSSISLEDISGGPILYPMQGFTYAMIQKYFRPWAGDVSKRSDFSNTINPAFTLRLMAEVVGALGALANTDARAQYRLRFTLAPLVQSGSNGLVSVGTGVTAPTVTVNVYINTFAQPDLQDLLGNPIEQVPRGIVASRFNMHEIPPLTSGNNVIRATLTGNELRGLMLLVRNGGATAPRVNFTDANAGAIDLRIDNRRLWKMRQSQLVEEMQNFYPYLGAGTWTRETGVYVYPRFNGGDVLAGGGLVGEGDYWLQTVEQSLIQFEFGGGDISTPPGTVEIVYDALAIAGPVPATLEGV
jgi:hypothetical protein